MLYLYIAAAFSVFTVAFTFGYDMGHAAASHTIWRQLEDARNEDLQS